MGGNSENFSYPTDDSPAPFYSFTNDLLKTLPAQGKPQDQPSMQNNGYAAPNSYSPAPGYQPYETTAAQSQPQQEYPYANSPGAFTSSQALVTTTNQSSQWSIGGMSAPPALGNTQSFDPFA